MSYAQVGLKLCATRQAVYIQHWGMMA